MARKNLKLNPDAPATLEDIVTALLHLRRYDESQLQELVSSGRLRHVLARIPFRARADIPADTVPKDELKRASALPLSGKARLTLIRRSVWARPKKSK